ARARTETKGGRAATKRRRGTPGGRARQNRSGARSPSPGPSAPGGCFVSGVAAPANRHEQRRRMDTGLERCAAFGWFAVDMEGDRADGRNRHPLDPADAYPFHSVETPSKESRNRGDGAEPRRFLKHDEIEQPIVHTRRWRHAHTIAKLAGIGDGDDHRAIDGGAVDA